MKIIISLISYLYLSHLVSADTYNEYLRKHEKDLIFFDNIPPKNLTIIPCSSNQSDTNFDLDRIKKCVYEIMLITKDSNQFIEIHHHASAFALQVNGQIYLASSYHAISGHFSNGKNISVIAKNNSGDIFHIVSFELVSMSNDFVLMRPSLPLEDSLMISNDIPKELEAVTTCGALGDYRFVFRSGETMLNHDMFFLASLAASAGSSGSPVLDQNGKVVGIITEIIPVFRESGLYSGDHFSESVMTKCMRIK